MRSRYYNPVWGRFINPDSIVCENIYSYCHNKPINRNDITGKSDVRFDDLDDTNDWLSERTSGGFGGFSDYGIRVPDISSTYYSLLNVRATDAIWVNSTYNSGYYIMIAGFSKAPKTSFVADMIYNKLDNEDPSIIVSRTYYRNYLPYKRDDFYTGSKPHKQYDKESMTYLYDHTHLYYYNDNGFKINERIIHLERTR